jgi:hypothetical protein
MITNTLQKKLNQLQKEKIELEVTLEQEQEFIVNRLTRQLEGLQRQGSSGNVSPLVSGPGGVGSGGLKRQGSLSSTR